MTRIAIDGGQSALRLRVLPSRRTGTGPGYTHGPDARSRMLAAISDAAAEAGVSGPVEVVALGLTGYPQAAGTAEDFAAEIGELLNADEVRLSQDMVTAHAGACPDRHDAGRARVP